MRTLQLQAAIAKIASAGFFHIFLTSVLNKILAFLCAVLVVRILSKADYGVYSYAFNLLNISLLFNGLGAASAVLQLASESRELLHRVNIERYGLRIGLAFDCLLCIIMLVVALFVPLPIEGSAFLLMLCVAYPMPQFVFELQSSILRAEFQNKKYAVITNINTLLTVAASVGGAAIGGAIGLIVGRNLAVILSVVVIYLRYKIPLRKVHSASEDRLFPHSDKQDFVKIAVTSSINNGIGSLTYLIGTFFIGVFLSDAVAVASYQAATAIPIALNFIPASLVTFIYPYFARNRTDMKWIFRWYPKVILVTFFVAVGIAIPSIVLSPQIVVFVYGSSYLDSVPSFVILMVGFALSSSLRVISGNLLVAQRKLLFNTFMTTSTIVLLTVLSIVLIPQLGIVGAAISQALSLTISGIASTLYLIYVYKSLDDTRRSLQ